MRWFVGLIMCVAVGGWAASFAAAQTGHAAASGGSRITINVMHNPTVANQPVTVSGRVPLRMLSSSAGASPRA